VALEELGVPYEKIRLQLDKGDQKKPEFLAINPNGKVPALVDGDARMFESYAILVWLGERYGVEKGMWPKVGSPEHAEALSWSTWAVTEMQAPFYDVVMNAVDVPWAHPKEHRSAHTAAHGLKNWKTSIEVLDKRLEGRDWIMGKQFTLVDLAAGLVAAMGPMFASLPVTGKNVEAYVGRLTSRPSFAKVMSEQ
jgi:glutathione S-transferase